MSVFGSQEAGAGRGSSQKADSPSLAHGKHPGKEGVHLGLSLLIDKMGNNIKEGNKMESNNDPPRKVGVRTR